ncbi:N-6 DNA methylase, partial [Streptomonospora algeriensis]
MAEIHEITAAEIARLARVSRTTVSNWRRRHDDFPGPVGGTDTRPTFDRDEVERWLEDGGRLPPTTPFESVWNRIRSMAEGQEREELLADVLSVLLFRMEDMLGRHPDYPLTWSDLVDDEDAPGWLRGAMKETLVGSKQAEEDRVPEFFSGNQEGLIRLCREVGAMADSLDRARKLADFLFTAHLQESKGGREDPPAPLARLMAALGGVDDGQWGRWGAPDRGQVLDPSCGSGSLLVEARHRRAHETSGQEGDRSIARLAGARIDIAAGRPTDSLRPGSALLADAFPGRKFGVVLCKPPFGQKYWGAEQLAVDERWVYGTPPRAESELAWVQHCLSHAETGGRVVVLLPPAVASRGSGRRIRAEFLRRGALRAVVA